MDLFEYFTTDNISGKKCNEKWLKVNNLELYNEVMNWCDDHETLKNIEFKRKVYHYINKLNEIPVCKTCGLLVKYSRIRDGYRTYCSDKCVKSSSEYYQKWLNSISKTLESGDFIKKREKTWKEKYGDDFYKSIQKKRKEKIIEYYGCENVFQLEEIKYKRKETLIEKYGSEKYNNPDKTRNTRIKNGTQINDEMIDGFLEYKKVAINRTITIYRNNQRIINPESLKRSKKSYHIDHLFSIKQGFLSNLPVEVISHPCNLHMIYYKENLVKQDNCWITLSELLEKIISYEIELNFTHNHLKNKYSKIKEISESLLKEIK